MFLQENVIFILAYLFYIGAILVHVFVISKVLPYHLINGGRSASYEVQVKQSIMSIVILGLGIVYVSIGFLIPQFKRSIVFMILSFILALFWLLGTVMQLLGTKFERYYISWINLVGVISHVLLALIYFSEDI
jgi:hypothetical protein